MSPTLVRHQVTASSPGGRPPAAAASGGRTRDWADIQERMLVPLYEAVYGRLGVGPGTRLLALGCGTGLALELAAGLGAQVSGVDAEEQRLALARERLRSRGGGAGAGLTCGDPEGVAASAGGAFTVVTAFHPVGCLGGVRELSGALRAAVALAERGSAVVLGGWGPAERCAAADVLGVARRWAEPSRGGGWRPSGRDDLEELAEGAGLRPDGSGRVACPFGYADMAGAVRGLLSTGVFDGALEAAGARRVEKELRAALRPYRRADGTVWLPNVFRYLIARTP